MGIPTQSQECFSRNVKHGHVSLTKSYSSLWFLLSIHLQHCRYSVSHTQKKTEYAWKNELRPTLTSLQYRSSTLKTIKCKQPMKCHISGCLKISCFPGEPCQHKEPRRMSFHIHPRPNFATGVETSIVRNMTWLTKGRPYRHFGCGEKAGLVGQKKHGGPSQLDESTPEFMSKIEEQNEQP